MKLINKENGEELVEVGSHKEYASKGVAGTGLGLGIAGTALWLLSGGLGGGLFGIVQMLPLLLVLAQRALLKKKISVSLLMVCDR